MRDEVQPETVFSRPLSYSMEMEMTRMFSLQENVVLKAYAMWPVLQAYV